MEKLPSRQYTTQQVAKCGYCKHELTDEHITTIMLTTRCPFCGKHTQVELETEIRFKKTPDIGKILTMQ